MATPPKPSEHIQIRMNLAAAIFPFQSDLQGRTIIVAGQDENYNYLDQIGEPVKDRGIPQASYMHNCMPTAQGYQAIGYQSQITNPGHSLNDFDTVFSLAYTTPNIARVLFVPAQGANYVFDGSINSWVSASPITPGTISATTMVTTANVNGVTYVCYAGYGILTYNLGAGTMTNQNANVLGITATAIQGIASAYGYMIAWDINNNVYWSNITGPNPLDFQPSLITGAGGGAVQAAKGRLLFCAPIAGGFIAYCERNAVGFTYSGNFNFPFVGLEVSGSGGAFSPEDVTITSNETYHYAWTTAGIQQLTISAAQNVFPEATEFLEKLIFEDFNEQTLQFTTTFLTWPLNTKISLIADRYVVFSYGITYGSFTHALVFDITLNRWGKLKITHTKAFEYSTPNMFGSVTYGMLAPLAYGQLQNTTNGSLNSSVAANETPGKNLAFMDANGNISTVDFDLSEALADGVLLLGKVQYVRNRTLIHQKSDIENIPQGNTFNYYVVPTLDGKTLQPPVLLTQAPNIISQGSECMLVGGRVSGKTLSFLCIGSFNLVSIILDFTLGGER